MLSSADSGGGEVQKDYQLFCNQYKSHGKVLRQSAFLGGAPIFFFPLGCRTALRVSDLLFHRRKMGTITATSRGCREDRVRHVYTLLGTLEAFSAWQLLPMRSSSSPRP